MLRLIFHTLKSFTLNIFGERYIYARERQNSYFPMMFAFLFMSNLRVRYPMDFLSFLAFKYSAAELFSLGVVFLFPIVNCADFCRQHFKASATSAHPILPAFLIKCCRCSHVAACCTPSICKFYHILIFVLFLRQHRQHLYSLSFYIIIML